MIKAICFDLDGVYFDSSGFTSFKNALVKTGLSLEEINSYFHGQPTDVFKKGQITESEYWVNAKKVLGIDMSIEDIKSLLVAGYSVNQDVHSMVLEARKQGYKTCICSNNFTTRIELLDAKFNFLQHFDVTAFSYQIGELKPSPVIFKELIRLSEVQPNELVYSDDSADKLSGAKELGVLTFVFQNPEQFRQKLSELDVRLA